jgi:hypothetical protein
MTGAARARDTLQQSKESTAMYSRLVIIVFWLMLGLTLLGTSWLYPELIQGQGQPAARTLGWLAIVYAVYHSARLAIDYAVRRRRPEPETALLRRRRPARAFPSEPDSNFDFTETTPEQKET